MLQGIQVSHDDASLIQIRVDGPKPAAITGVVLVESTAQPLAQSPRQARGLWQFIPETARQYGLEVRDGRDERVDIERATQAAPRYLHDLYQRFENWPLALASYFERKTIRMAKVVLAGIEKSVARALQRALAVERHQIKHKPVDAPVNEFLGADIVFAAADGKRYIPLLRNLRQVRPELPFIVVTRVPETSDWLDALEAGATDYCSLPIELRQINWLMESALPRVSRLTD